MGWGNFTRGFEKAFSSPVSAIANVVTLGHYSLINENKKAAASIAAGGAAGFITGGPGGALIGAGVGGVNSAINKRDIADSALQSALYGGAAGSVLTIAPKLASLKTSLLTGNKAAFTKTAVATKAATTTKAAGSGTFMETLKTVGIMSALQKFGTQAGQSFGLIPTGAVQDNRAAEQAYVDARRDLMAATNESPSLLPDAAPILAGASPVMIFFVVGLMVTALVALVLKKRKR